MKKFGMPNSEKMAYAVIVLFLGLIILMLFQYYGSRSKGIYPLDFSMAKVNEDDGTVLKTGNGNGMLVLYPGTKSDASEITIQSIENPSIDSDVRISGMYKFGPSGAKFSKPVEIRIKYDGKKTGGCPSTLYFYHFNDDGSRKEVVQSKSVYCGIDTAVFEINGFSQGYAGHESNEGETCLQNKRACRPQISSINPATAEKGVTLLRISGNELTDVVQFFDSGNKRYTVLGSVNSPRTETTIIVPAEVPSGQTRVRIYAAADKVSNEKAFTITGTGTASGHSGSSTGNLFIKPANAWSPKQTTNGWFPQLSPDGRYVTYGFGENWVADLQTGEEKSMTITKGESFNGYWIKPDTYTFLNIYSGSEANRYEVKIGEWIPKKTNDNPRLTAGNIMVAADNHWASYLASNGRIAYDNNELATGVGGALSISNDWIVHATDNDNSAIQVWKNKQKVATYNPQTPLFGTSVNKGYIIYGGYGPVRGITPDGQDIDLTVAPWRWEGVGGVVFVNNQPWVYTLIWNDAQNKGYILIRPWGEKASIVIEAAAVSVHAVYVNNEFVIAFNDDKGNLRVIKVPANSKRADLSNPTGTAPTNPNNGNNPTPTPSNPTTGGTIIAQKDLGPGTFPDVAFHNGRLWLAVQQDNQLKLYNFGTDLSNQQATTIPINGGQTFPKLTIYDNVLWLAYRAGDSSSGIPESIKLWRSDTQAIEDLGGGFGNDPVAVGNGYVAWQKDGKVQRRQLTGGQAAIIRNQLPTGISRILADGSVKMIDEDRLAVPGYTLPWWANDLAVAEGPTGGVIGFFGNDYSKPSFTLWEGKDTFAPRAAADENGNYAVATWSPRSSGDTARVAVIRKS